MFKLSSPTMFVKPIQLLMALNFNANPKPCIVHLFICSNYKELGCPKCLGSDISPLPIQSSSFSMGLGLKCPTLTTFMLVVIRVTRFKGLFDAAPSSLMDSTTSPKVMTSEGKGVEAHSLAHITLGVEGRVVVSKWGLG